MNRRLSIHSSIWFILILNYCQINKLQAFDNEIPLFKIENFQTLYELNPSLQYFADTSNQLTIENFQTSHESFAFSDYHETLVLNPNFNHWVRFRILLTENIGMSMENWFLFIGKADFFDLYLLDEDLKLVAEENGGTLLPSRKKTLKKGNHVRRLPISMKPGTEYLAYLRYTRINKQGLDINLELKKFDYYQSWEYVKNNRRDWLFLGFILTMLLLNFTFYLITKSRGYLYHGVFISGVFIFTADFFGITPDLFFIRDNPKLIQGIDYFALAMIDLGYFQFIRQYLDLAKSSPKWNLRFHNIVIVKLIFYVCIIAFHYITYNEPVADKMLAAFILLGFVFIILFLILYAEKSRKQYFLLAGTLFLFFAISLNAISILQEKGLLTLFTEIGLAAEIAVFSIALAYRRARFLKEEQKARYLLELDSFKNKFYTNITHEFRTPLTIINGMTDTAKDKLSSLDTAGIFNSLTKIRSQSNNVLKLVNQMLDLSKLESKSLKFTLKQKNLVELIQTVVQEFEILALQKEIDLSFKTGMSTCYMDMDEEYLRSVLTNLLSNAIKFTNATGKVEVLCESQTKNERNGVIVTIKDSGVGIQKDQLGKIFDRFYQVEASGKTNYSSTGVGLSLSKEIIQLMDGEIFVESEFGKGSSFKFWIPVTQEKEREEITKKAEIITETESDIFSGTEKSDQPIVLIIDDYEDILDYLESILKNNYKVERASNGLEGLKKAEELIPDIIISDIMMPYKDGYELCDDLKTNEKTNHIPIILLTAKSDHEDRIKGWKTGADVYLTKPFSKEELFAQLKKLNTLTKNLQKKYSQFAFIENKTKLKKENTFIHNIHSLLDTHLGNADFSVDQLAKCLFMSRMQLHRKIKALSNKSASHYIRSYRMHKAKIMLKDLNNTIGHVAFETGYEDPSYFSKSFHQEFGISPSVYRESLK